MAAAREVPPALEEASARVREEFSWYQKAIGGLGNRIYGANTLTGHLDGHRLNNQEIESLQDTILETHQIGSAPFFDEPEARLIGYTKACTVAAGGTGLSPTLYRHLLASIGDDAFRPMVPRAASYSCGDVIPGAHWAGALLAHDTFRQRHKLQPGEGLALINGVFVDLGSSVALLPQLQRAILDMLVNMRAAANVFAQGRAQLEHRAREPGPVADVLKIIASGLPELPATTRQLPVSLRATPELVEVAISVSSQFNTILDNHLQRGSANPYVCPETGHILSQASFMAPDLSVAKSSVCEMVLFAMWACQSRISAACAQLEARLLTTGDAMTAVQIPKLTQALLEDARLLAGRRAFAGGSSTSSGVEDLWTYGANLTNQLRLLIADWRRMESAQHRVLALLRTSDAGRPEQLQKFRHDILRPIDFNPPDRADLASTLDFL